MTSPPVLEGRAIVAGYVPGVPILRGCDLRVGPGELVGVIGPNGAGKSTLVKALFGLVPLRSGSVWFRDEDVTALPAHMLVRRGLGYVPQVRNVFPALSVADNLRMGTYLVPARFEERFAVVAELFPVLSERPSARAGSLSGGQRQMLSMARALMSDPSVLLLDEPSAGLSPMIQDDVFARIEAINVAGAAVVMVEQNARRCLQIAARAYVLDQGTAVHEGTGAALLNDPKIVDLYLGGLRRS